LLIHRSFKRKKGKKKVVAVAEVSNGVQFFLIKYYPSRHKFYIPDLIQEACYEDARVEIFPKTRRA
jgi:hypothetical protein